MTFAAVSPPVYPANTQITGAGSTAKTFTLAPHGVGNFILLEVVSETAADHVTGITSGNGNVTWSVLVSATTIGSVSATVLIGEVNSTSSGTQTIATSAGSPQLRFAGQEFSTTAGFSAVTLDTSGTVNSTTLDYPSLTPGHGAGELYFGYALNGGSGYTPGSTTGYTYLNDSSGNGVAFNPACGSGAQQPVWAGTADTLQGIAVLLRETAHTATASLTVTPSFSASRAHVQSRSASLTVTPSLGATGNGRSQYTWPFSYDSPWNLPVSADAEYAPSGIVVTSDYSTNASAVEYCCTDPAQPVKSLTNAELSGGGIGAANVYVAPAMSAAGTWNDCGAFLGSADNDTVYQGQTLELTAGGNPSWGGDADAPSATVSIKSTGITGSHGGSGLSALGGTLTAADLTGPGPIQHAMKVCFNGYLYYSSAGTGYQWPAVSADGGYNVPANANYYGGSNAGVVLGALLALPPFIDPATKYSDPLIQRIATAMQCYGCYIVDNTASGPGVSDSIIEVNYDAASDFTGTGTFSSDFHQMLEDLQVVTNSAEATPGGGAIGSNRFAPYAPPFADGTDAPPAVTVVAPSSVLMQSLTDSFPGSSLNPQWGDYGTVAVSGGQAAIDATTGESGIYSAAGYMLTGSYMLAKVTPYTGGTGPYIYFQAAASSGNGGAGIQYNSGSLYAYWVSSTGTVTDLSSITYNATSHAWWRIRESGGTTYFDTAPDGATWTNQWSVADPIVYNSMLAEIGSGISSGTAGNSFLADFNVPGGTSHTATASLTATPVLAASRVHGNARSAALTVTPVLAAAAAAGTAAALTVTPSLSASARHGNARSAALTVTPALSASGTSGFPVFTVSASLTVAPSLAASPSAAHTASAALTATPSFSASRAHAQSRSASLTVMPVLSASAASAVSASLAVTPVLSATAVRGHSRTAALAVTPAFTPATATAHVRAASLTASPVLSAAAHSTAPVAFPAAPLDLECQLNLAGTWTDVTTCAYQREGTSPPIAITRGRPDESSTANPAAATWEWNNRDGRFSPKNPLSPYYGELGRNTPVRWSVPASSPYLRLENDSADRAYVNDNSRLNITGSIDIRIELRLTGWQGGVLAHKWDGGAAGCWYWQLNADGTLSFGWTDSGSTFQSVTSSQPVPFAAGTFALRVTMDATDGNVTFYTSTAIGGSWTQLGSVASGTGGASTSIISETGSALTCGYSFAFTPAQVFGSVHEIQLYSGIGGTLEADGIFTAQAAGATSWTDAQGNLWQLAGGAEISARNYRFHGEMSAQPPKWDVTGADQSVMAAAGGPLRRLSQGTANAMSAMKRAILLQTGSLVPQAYWSMEDAAGASVFGASLGPLAMTFDQSPAPALATDSSFLASAPLPTFGGSRFSASVAPYSGGSAVVARFLCKLGTITLLPGLTYAPLARVTTSGTVRVLYVVAFTGGGLGMIGYDSTGATVVNTGVYGFAAAGAPLWYSVEIQLVSGNVQCGLATLAPGASSGNEITATLSGGTVGNCTQVTLNPNALFTDTVAGHLTVQDTWSSLFLLGQPLNAWTGETAGSRYARLAGENGYQARVKGSPGQSALMGPQGTDTLANLLTEVEVADLGQQYEPRQQLSLGYRTLASMLNQAPALELDYSASQPGGVNGDGSDSGLDPTYDDQLTKNDWTLTRGSSTGSQGATWQAQLNDGSAMSISNPPTGVGDYAGTQTVNVEADSMLPDTAGWMVHTGTVDEARWPGVPLNLARTAIQDAGLYYPVLDADVGDYLSLENLPDVVLYDPVKQLAFGMKESLGGFHHTVEFNAVPESPYEVAVFDDPVYGRADTDGSALASGVSASATTLSVATTGPSGILWTTLAADFPFDIEIAGERMTVTNITGTSSPQSFTVTRAVNGVSKAQASGADVRLWFPPIMSLA